MVNDRRGSYRGKTCRSGLFRGRQLMTHSVTSPPSIGALQKDTSPRSRTCEIKAVFRVAADKTWNLGIVVGRNAIVVEIVAQSENPPPMRGPRSSTMGFSVGRITGAIAEWAGEDWAGTLKAPAIGLESASCAVRFTGAVEDRRIVIHQSSRRGQHLAARAKVDVALVVIDEIVAREGIVFAGRFVEYSHVRLDAVFTGPAKCPMADSEARPHISSHPNHVDSRRL
jgi:hypothetical protein